MSARLGGLAGAVAAGVALAVSELMTAALDSNPSLITAVGSEFIDRYAASLKDLAVALFGTNDKRALIIGIVIVSVALGAGLGAETRRRWFVAPIGFAAFGALGASALATDPQGSTSTAIISGIVAAAAGIGSLMLLSWLYDRKLRMGASTVSDTTTTESSTDRDGVPPAGPVAVEPTPGPSKRTILDRRGFLVGVGGLAVVAGSSTVLARRLRSAGSVESARSNVVLPRPTSSSTPTTTATRTPSSFRVPGLSPYITPNPDFYLIDTALAKPRVDVDGWRLSITGLVDNPFELTYDELLALDSVEETVTLSCVSNEVGGDLVGNAVWQGVPLADLLDRAGVQSGASQIVGRSVDDFTAGFPTADGLDGRMALVAYAMNGEPLPVDHGYPARLVVAGLYGYVSATKWLREIELTTWEDFDGYWVPRGWSKEGPVKTASRIDVPIQSAGTIAAGRQAIAGVAWAPDRGIERVEVRIDDGDWQECELAPSVSDDTWVQWRLLWDATSGIHTATVRATDGDGVTQTEEQNGPAPNGATGWHSRMFTVE